MTVDLNSWFFGGDGMKIKKGDFVELDYVGMLTEEGKIFDLTSEKLAKEKGIHQAHRHYGAKIICVGEGNIVRGIDEFLVGKETRTYTLPLSPEQAFGKKKKLSQALAEEIIAAYKSDQKALAISKKQELERQADASR